MSSHRTDHSEASASWRGRCELDHKLGLHLMAGLYGRDSAPTGTLMSASELCEFSLAIASVQPPMIAGQAWTACFEVVGWRLAGVTGRVNQVELTHLLVAGSRAATKQLTEAAPLSLHPIPQAATRVQSRPMDDNGLSLGPPSERRNSE